jgi:hypothetical protein
LNRSVQFELGRGKNRVKIGDDKAHSIGGDGEVNDVRIICGGHAAGLVARIGSDL